MATMGPTTIRNNQRLAGNILRLARIKRDLTQRQLASAAGVSPSTIGRIESGAVQPSLPTLAKLLAAVNLDLRIHLEQYDDHDDVLNRLADRLTPTELARRQAIQDEFTDGLRPGA
jgi:transcriptional regulator with XRE-family HTH domain